MEREVKGRRVRITFIIAGVLLLLATVPWLVSFAGYLKEGMNERKNMSKAINYAVDKWKDTGYIEKYLYSFSDKYLIIASGLVFVLMETGIAFGLAPQGVITKDKTNAVKGRRWGPPVAGHGEFGSAHWQSKKEIEKSTTIWRTGEKLKKGGVVLGVDKDGSGETYYLSTDDTHTLIIGTTRSGKTRLIILPTIWAIANAGESMVLTDPKGELFLSSKEYLEKMGYKIVVMNYREPEKSNYWNVLKKVINDIENNRMTEAEQTAREIAESLVDATQKKTSDSFWADTSKSVITALVMLIAIEADKENQKHMYGANYMLGQYGRPDEYENVPLTMLIDKLPIDHPARRAWYTAGIASDKTRSSIFASALSSMQLFSDSKIGWITSHQDHELEDVGVNKTAVFLIIPDERAIYNVMATLYVDQLFQTMVTLANKFGGRIPRRVNFILDEFGNLPALPEFEKKLTVAGGRGMRFAIAVQGLDQLEKLYREAAKTITGNCHTWVYRLTSDPKTAEEIEKRVGRYTIATQSQGMSAQYGSLYRPSSSSNTSFTGRPLVMQDELMRWEMEDGNLVLRVREQPARFPISEFGKLQASADFEMGNQQQVLELHQNRNDALSVNTIKSPSLWKPVIKDFISKYVNDLVSEDDSELEEERNRASITGEITESEDEFVFKENEAQERNFRL